MPENDPQKAEALKRLCLKIAQLCVDSRFACRSIERYANQSVAFARTHYRSLALLCHLSDEACKTLADLCLEQSPSAAKARECAEACEHCAAETEKLDDPQLGAFIEACRKTAEACRELLVVLRS